MKKLKFICLLCVGATLLSACGTSVGNSDGINKSDEELYKEVNKSEEQIRSEKVAEENTKRAEKVTKLLNEMPYPEQIEEKLADAFGPLLQEVKYAKEEWGTEKDGNYILKNGTGKINIEDFKKTIRQKADAGTKLEPLELAFLTESTIKVIFPETLRGYVSLLHEPGIQSLGARRRNTDNVEDALMLFKANHLFVREGDRPEDEGLKDFETFRFEVPPYLETDFLAMGDENVGVKASFVHYFPDARVYIINKANKEFRFFNYDGLYLGSASSSIRWWEEYEMKVKEGSLMRYYNGVLYLQVEKQDLPEGLLIKDNPLKPLEGWVNPVRISMFSQESTGYFVFFDEQHARDGIISAR